MRTIIGVVFQDQSPCRSFGHCRSIPLSAEDQAEFRVVRDPLSSRYPSVRAPSSPAMAKERAAPQNPARSGPQVPPRQGRNHGCLFRRSCGVLAPKTKTGRRYCQASGKAGVGIYGISHYFLETPERSGFLIGFAHLNDKQIQEGIQLLRCVFLVIKTFLRHDRCATTESSMSVVLGSGQ
jgi:hypothetical protein